MNQESWSRILQRADDELPAESGMREPRRYSDAPRARGGLNQAVDAFTASAMALEHDLRHALEKAASQPRDAAPPPPPPPSRMQQPIYSQRSVQARPQQQVTLRQPQAPAAREQTPMREQAPAQPQAAQRQPQPPVREQAPVAPREQAPVSEQAPVRPLQQVAQRPAQPQTEAPVREQAPRRQPQTPAYEQALSRELALLRQPQPQAPVRERAPTRQPQSLSRELAQLRQPQQQQSAREQAPLRQPPSLSRELALVRPPQQQAPTRQPSSQSRELALVRQPPAREHAPQRQRSPLYQEPPRRAERPAVRNLPVPVSGPMPYHDHPRVGSSKRGGMRNLLVISLSTVVFAFTANEIVAQWHNVRWDGGQLGASVAAADTASPQYTGSLGVYAVSNSLTFQTAAPPQGEAETPSADASAKPAGGKTAAFAAPASDHDNTAGQMPQKDTSLTLASAETPAASAERRSSGVTELEEQVLMRRATALLEQNDVVGARQLLEYLATRESAVGAYSLARTYDAAFLSGLPENAMKADSDLAGKWYKQAALLGSSEAKDRLDQQQN